MLTILTAGLTAAHNAGCVQAGSGGDSTQVSGTFEAEPGGFFKLADPLLVRIGKRQFEGDLANLKDLMEANAL